MLIVGLFDKCFGKYTQFIPTPKIDVLKRDFKNTMKPGNVYHDSAEDFKCVVLVEINQFCLSCSFCKDSAISS